MTFDSLACDSSTHSDLFGANRRAVTYVFDITADINFCFLEINSLLSEVNYDAETKIVGKRIACYEQCSRSLFGI